MMGYPAFPEEDFSPSILADDDFLIRLDSMAKAARYWPETAQRASGEDHFYIRMHRAQMLVWAQTLAKAVELLRKDRRLVEKIQP